MTSIDTTSVLYDKMAEDWALPMALAGGAKAMRSAGEKYLPKEPLEDEKSYKARLERTFLHNAFGEALDGLAGQVFSRDILLTDESETISNITTDIDMCGYSLSRFAKNVFKTGETFGLSHILVDVPSGITANNLAEQRALGVRPYFVEVAPTQLFAWKHDDLGRLYHIRFKESVVVEKDQYTDEYVEQIRVIETNFSSSFYQIWRKSKDGKKWELYEEGERTLPGIGLSTVYLNKTGELQGSCPLNELAWLNLEHWQSASDQKNILHMARVPRLFAKCLGEEGIKSMQEHGISQFIVSENEHGEASWIEHSGKAIESGEKDLERLEIKMAKHSLEPMVKRTGNETATAKAIDTAKGDTRLQDWAIGLQDGVINALKIADEWMGTESSNMIVDVNKDFNISLTANEDFAQLLDMNARRKISDKTLLKEAKRLNKLSDDVDVDLELEQAQEIA